MRLCGLWSVILVEDGVECFCGLHYIVEGVEVFLHFDGGAEFLCLADVEADSPFLG